MALKYIERGIKPHQKSARIIRHIPGYCHVIKKRRSIANLYSQVVRDTDFGRIITVNAQVFAVLSRYWCGRLFGGCVSVFGEYTDGDSGSNNDCASDQTRGSREFIPDEVADKQARNRRNINEWSDDGSRRISICPRHELLSEHGLDACPQQSDKIA